MKITKTQLKQIIKEEIAKVMTEVAGGSVENLILEGKMKDAKEKFNNTLSQALLKSPEEGGINWEELFKKLKIMPKGKAMHSLRVGGHAAAAGADADEIIGALMHDYVERGGDVDKLVAAKLITDKQKAIILALSSSDEDVAAYAGENEPLHHMEEVFAKMAAGDKSADIRGTLAMVKAGDRVDNLNRRVWDPDRKGKVTKKKYLKKSADLFNFLRNGDGLGGGSVWQPTGSSKAKVDGVLNRLEPEAKQALVGFAPEVFAGLGWEKLQTA